MNGTESAKINAAMTLKPQTVAAIAEKAGLRTSRVRNHMAEGKKGQDCFMRGNLRAVPVKDS